MKKDGISEMLDNEIEALINRLGELEPGTEEHESVTKDLERLYKLRIEETKVVGDIDNQREKIEVEKSTNDRRLDVEIENNADKVMEDRRQHKSNKRAGYIELGAKIGCALLVGVLGLIYEEHGALRSPTRKVLEATFRPKL